MAMADLLVGIAIVYAGAIGLYVSAKLILDGHVLRSIFFFLIGTPMLMLIAEFIFGLIATGINAIFLTTMKSPFRT